jgi:hypothetical protein
MGEVSLEVSSNGLTTRGRATSTDIVEASIRAYVVAVNRLMRRMREGGKDEEKPHGM